MEVVLVPVALSADRGARPGRAGVPRQGVTALCPLPALMLWCSYGLLLVLLFPQVKGGERALEAAPPAPACLRILVLFLMAVPLPSLASPCLEVSADVQLPSFTDRVYIGGNETWSIRALILH